MRHTIKLYSIPLWPFVKNVFIVSLTVFILGTLLFGIFWLGLFRQFAMYMPDSGVAFQPDAFQNIGGLFVMVFSVFNGVIGSVLFTVFAGVGALMYNWVNARSGGFEFEISLPDSFRTEVQSGSQSEVTTTSMEVPETKVEQSETEKDTPKTNDST
ncbi:MAG: DUF3566 domain-containing protein [Candidatus Marinimicrobia bacterium]|nr:DUF3566 domain-containing protein [Candidatus Neomarinimicrobiota bacterium]MCF7827357.1 DUF3566 domain-containing protein [Candidatus Neomarinimicrobiota bacterium]MCF7881410.1 DUF3566 domain-containing protein [Candidatus Neomarinimicrobiota bacterium]